jgi:LysM repeat protein/uncharacterized protein YvpB
MSDERGRAEGGLVGLYAERLRYRNAVQPGNAFTPRRSSSLQHFGRRPPVRRKFPMRRGAAVSAVLASALMVGTQAASAATYHEVKPGETLGEIAAQYNVSLDQLVQLNSLSNPNLIVSGTTLTIDSDTPDTSPASSVDVRQHVVLQGETLYQIAQQYGMTVESLAQVNNLANPNIILPGTALKIPAVSSAATGSAKLPATASDVTLHLVAAGETLMGIANQYHVSLSALTSANNISNPNLIEVGDLLRIPGGAPAAQDGSTKLRAMPVMQQSLPLSCEAAAVSIATAYWGNQVSEWVFIENIQPNPNPHLGFRGDITGAFGGTDNYGVYAEPFQSVLSNYGFGSDVFYANGNANFLKAQIDQGRPVVVWMTNLASVQTRSYETVDGSRFALVPQEHAVVVYGYDDNGVSVADPGDGSYRQFTWNDFMRSWGYFDGMSLVVYPQQ